MYILMYKVMMLINQGERLTELLISLLIELAGA